MKQSVIDSVRAKLTFWHICVLALIMVVFSLSVYLLLSGMLRMNMDAALRASVETAAVSLSHEIDEGESPRQAANSVIRDIFIPQQTLAVFNSEGRLLAEHHGHDQPEARLPDTSLIPIDHPAMTSMKSSPGGVLRLAAERVRIGPASSTYLIAAGQTFEAVDRELAAIRQVFYFAIPLALLLAGIGGWFLARKSLAPVAAMSRMASHINAGNLTDRLPVANPRDELGQLATTFNDLLARLNAAFAQQKQFMADASHELRTPLHVVRTAAAVTMGRAHREEAEYRDALKIIDEQSSRLTRIVEEMLTLSRADAGHPSIVLSDFYLDELVSQTAQTAGILARDKGINIDLAPAAESPYKGDENILRRLLLNLLDN
ncbi:MAG: HAMP domain-containing protein, partial [Blastocatellia bacterium]|nr:HAMP domain-containing protein [Blastocatellia bacterium]